MKLTSPSPTRRSSGFTTILGVALIIAGIAFGLYVGIYLMLWGGILAVITQVRAEHLDAASLAWGVVRIMCAGLVGSISGWTLVIPGYLMVTK